MKFGAPRRPMTTLAEILRGVECYGVEPDSVRLALNGRANPAYRIYRDEDGMLVVDLSEWHTQ